MVDKPFPAWLRERILGIAALIRLSKEDYLHTYGGRDNQHYAARRLGRMEGLYKALTMDFKDAGYLHESEVSNGE